jgi:hypothetical protein
MTEQPDPSEYWHDLRGTVIAYLTAQTSGDPELADHDAGKVGLAEVLSLLDPLEQASQDVVTALLMHALDVARVAVVAWSASSEHEIPALLDALRHP